MNSKLKSGLYLVFSAIGVGICIFACIFLFANPFLNRLLFLFPVAGILFFIHLWRQSLVFEKIFFSPIGQLTFTSFVVWIFAGCIISIFVEGVKSGFVWGIIAYVVIYLLIMFKEEPLSEPDTKSWPNQRNVPRE